MLDEFEMEALLALDGARFEAAAGYVVEFMARRTEATKERPHGLSYALVFRPLMESPMCVSITPMRLSGAAANM